MTAFNSLTPQLIDLLKEIVGGKNMIIDREKMIDYSHDEYAQSDIAHAPDVVVKPDNSRQVSDVLKFASAHNLPVTPRGGGTGLCGGCVPVRGGIVLSLENMRQIVEVDGENLMLVAQSGVTLTEIYRAVESAGLFFPPHPGDESATLGGVIATNAGGARAVKYGVIRNFVRGIEAVLPDGAIIRLGGKLMKNSTGYSLLNLLIGSEGTLGVVTQATINLMAEPPFLYTLVAPFANLEDAIKTVPRILAEKILPMAVEFIDRKAMRVTEHFLDKKWPSDYGEAHLMIILDGGSEEELMALAQRVGDICSANGAGEIAFTDTADKQRTVLELRSHSLDSLRDHMLEILDITIPRARIADFVRDSEALACELGMWLPTYGHAADGNVHTHIMKATWENGIWTEIPQWREKFPVALARLHALGKEYSGVISGEHGIGITKRDYVEDFLGARQIQLMREIKKVFDPQGILNPGKIFV